MKAEVLLKPITALPLAIFTALFLLIQISAFAAPISQGSETAPIIPQGCTITGGFNQGGIQKCVVDGITGQSICFTAKVDCCGNGRLDGALYDPITGALIHAAETCEALQDPSCRPGGCNKCGDGLIQSEYDEACDKGASNGTNGSNCTIDCKVPVCGNSIVETGGASGPEECDDGNSSNTDACTNTCRLPICGDGFVQAGEACDDGNRDATDSCANDCQGTCEYYRLNYDLGEAWSKGGHWINDPVKGRVYQSYEKVFRGQEGFDLSKLGCLSQIWGQMGNMYQSYNDFNDDTILIALELWINGHQDQARELVSDSAKHYGYYQIYYNFYRTDLSTKGFSDFHKSQTLINEVFFDQNCNPYFELPGRQGGLCGTVNFSIWGSPISLELNGKVDDEWKIVEFELQPGRNSWITWKGSAETPLLVFDPDHLGVVTDGSQLFGNWTELDSLKKTALDSSNSNYKWANGYKALAVLDVNLDGEISGNELDSLALWFDKNRNAISEPGEIKRIIDTGIVALSYNPDQVGRNGDLRVTQGFKRNQNGQLISGSSVDWYSPMYASQIDILTSLSSDFKNLQKPQDQLLEPATKTDSAINLSGFWLWEADSKSKNPALGLLYLVDQGDTVEGLSLVEEPLADNAKSYRSHLMRLKVKGTKSIKNGKTIFDFTVADQDGEKIKSSAILESDDRLSGESSAQLVHSDKDKPTEITYAWTATRKRPQKPEAR